MILGEVMTKDEYLDYLPNFRKPNIVVLSDMYNLYLSRDNEKKANEYYEKVLAIDKEAAYLMQYNDIIED